jgi:hypothetical protein
MNKSIFICTAVLFLCSCLRYERINYEIPIFPDIKHLNIEIINSDFMFRDIPFMVVYDSLLIACDPTINSIAHIFNKNDGCFIGSVGRIGQGPGELAQPMSFSFDYKRGRLFIHDLGKRATLSFDVNDVASIIEEIRFDNNELILNSSYFLRDSLFLFDIGRQTALGTTNQIFDRMLPKHPGYEENDGFGWWHFLGSHSMISINPEGNRFVVGTWAGGILYIYSVDEQKMNLESTKYFYKPIFKRNDALYDTSESKFGFFSLYLSNQFIYSTIFEKEKDFPPQNISKFDYWGNPIAQYNTDYPIFSIAVDEKDKYIYMAVLKDGELALGRTALFSR